MNLSEEFSHLWELRSLLCDEVFLMTLTSTATREYRRYICGVLGMSKVAVIAESPNKPNLRYSVIEMESSIGAG